MVTVAACRFLVLYGEICVLSVMMWQIEEYTLHQTLNCILFQVCGVEQTGRGNEKREVFADTRCTGVDESSQGE